MIYLVEDDRNIRELVVYTVRSTGREAMGFDRPSAFYEALKKQTPELVLLDIMLPEADGITVLKKLRDAPDTRSLPVIMLTAMGSEYDKVQGLTAGADDYIAKPFGMMELLARIEAVLRRCKSREKPGEYKLGCLIVKPGRHEVWVRDKEVQLTLKEFALLSMLLENRGCVLSRDQILDRIWGYAFDGESRTVDVHIRTLRRKLGEAGELIETVRGIGYKIDEGEGR